MLACEHHEVTHHHAFKQKSKFHESSINLRVFEALPRVFHPVDLNILLAIVNMPAAKRRKVSGPIGQTKAQQSTINFSGTKASRRTITSDEKPAKAAKAKIVSEAEEEEKLSLYPCTGTKQNASGPYPTSTNKALQDLIDY